MQIKTKHLLTMLVVAGMSVAAFPANAATITAGDLIFGFRVTGGTGAGFDLLVKADGTATGGNATIFRDATSPVTAVNAGTELSNLFGPNWHTRSDLYWGVVGLRAATSDALGSSANNYTPGRSPFAGAAASSPGTSSGYDFSSSLNGLDIISNNINTVRSNFLAGTELTGPAGAVQMSSSASGSWTDLMVNQINFGLGGVGEASNVNGIDATYLDLYHILKNNTDMPADMQSAANGVGLLHGTFSISNAGVISFNPVAAVPEPSRMLFSGIGLAVLFLRRRRTV